MNLYRLGLCGVLMTAAGILFAHPRTDTAVQKPVTSAVVTHPVTDTVVTRPKTLVQVSRPVTSVTVSHPATSVVVSHPTTQEPVFHPVTTAQVIHPGEKVVSAPAAGGTGSGSSSSSGKKLAPVNSVPSSSSATSMSGYKAPQAKDFKAASLGGGTAGLGNKTDEAAKDAAAAAFQVPKGEQVSLESVLKNANGASQAKITKAVEGKVK